MLICFSGIDGSGKTTYALGAFEELKKAGIKPKYIHFDSLFAQKLLSLVTRTGGRGRVHPKVDNSTERKTGVKTILKRTIWPWILFIDDLAFYALRFRKMKGLVISDRYFYDSAVSSVYSGASSSRFFAIYSRFFPSPDIMFLIDVEPKVAYDRKREESLEYLTKKRALYLELYRCVRCRKMKISSDDLRDASLQISSAIFALLTRYESESQNTPKSSVQRPADDS